MKNGEKVQMTNIPLNKVISTSRDFKSQNFHKF